jgi:hypothetical protein
MALIPHPQYSPDLALCDFFLFPKIKSKLKRRRFDTTEEIQAELHREKGLPEIVPKMEDKVGPASTCGRKLLQE